MSVKTIRLCVDGQLIQGSDKFMFNDIVHHLQNMERKHLLFLRQQWKIDWEKLYQSLPCVVITDIVYDQLKDIDGCTVIKVQNIDQAYWKFVESYRGRFSIPVISVTGTCGKTTTKDMIKHILRSSKNVTGTKSTANSRTNHLAYLLGIEEQTEAAVFESAVGKPGDVLLASRYFKPTIGVITNIGVYHLDGCKTEEAYIQAKAEMVQAVGPKGTLIVNADDENSKKIGLEKFHGKIVKFGIENKADFQATNIQYNATGMTFELIIRKGGNFRPKIKTRYYAFVPGFGQHQVLNALAALAAVHEIGIGIREAIKQLESFNNLSCHFECFKGKNGCLIVDDTWNSNPTSLKAAFQTLNGISGGRKRIALIGGIKRLGDVSLEIHRQTGEMIAKTGVDVLITVGSLAVEIANEARRKGIDGEVYSFSDMSEAETLLEKTMDKNSILLIKSSSTDDAIVNFKNRLKYHREN